MKKEDLLKAVGGADDRFIAEAAPKKINFKNRAPRYPMRLMTAAACLCIVAAVFFGYWLISPARLQKISLGTVSFSGEGAGAHTPVVRDISEYTTGNPWSAEMKLKRLPVYKNTQSLSCDDMLDNINKVAEKLGAQIKSVTRETMPDSDWVVAEDSLYAVRAETDIGLISAFATGGVSINFSEPVAGNGTGRDAAGYFIEKYSSVIGFKNPVLCVTSDYDINGGESAEYRVYDGSGGDLKRVKSYNFGSVFFDINENGGLESIRISSVDGAKRLGDYPIISYKEAEKLLLGGEYISGSADGIENGVVVREKIKKVELVYSIDPMDAYFAPYYRFYVELDRSPAAGFKCYGEFDVPAVNSKYIAN